MKYLRRIDKNLLNRHIFENLSSARAFLAKNKIPEDANFISIKELLKSNPGYIFTFTKFFYNDEKNIESLKYLYGLIKQLGRKIGELPQQIDKYDSYEKLLDDIMRIEEHTRFNRVVSELPAKFKKEAREDDNYFSVVATMNDNVYKDYLHLMKTKSFSFNEFDDLYQASIAHIDSYVNMTEVLKQLGETPGAKLTYNHGNIVVAHISTEEASKKLGSVSWCISSRGMWNHYNSPEKLTMQYFIWNFGVQYSSNDFRLGTTIKPDGVEQTSHLKDDSHTSLKSYCEKYKLDMDIFKPITKAEAVEVVKGLQMTKQLFNKCVDLDIWENLIDKIPFEWRLLRGLVLDTDELSPVQKLIAHGTIEEAVAFANDDMSFEQDYQRYMFLHKFNFDDVDDGDDIIDKVLAPLVLNNGKEIKYNTERKYYDLYINVAIPIEEFYETMDTEYGAYVHRAGSYGNVDGFFDYSEEDKYFHYYLNDVQKEQLVSLMESLGVDMGDDDEKWYDILSKYGVSGYIDDFMSEISSSAESTLDDMFKAEQKKLRFDYDDGYIEMNCENIIELISDKFEKLGDDYSLTSLIESSPNDKVSLPEYISLSECVTDDTIKEEGDKLIAKIEEHIEDNDELKDTVESYHRFRDMINRLGFEDDDRRITKETSQYKIAITKYLAGEGMIQGIITDKTSDKKRDFKIPLDQLPTYMSNHKLDLFFESLKY